MQVAAETDPEWLRVGEVAQRTGLTVRTLHHYDQIGLVIPSGRSLSDYRLYAPDDVRRLLWVQQLKALGLSLDEIAAALEAPDFDPASVLDRHLAAVTQRLADEQELLRRLTQLREASSSWSDVLEVIYLTEQLRHHDPSVRVRAALTGVDSNPLASLLAQLRTDPDPSVRETLTWAVVQHGDAATEAVIEHTRDADPGVRLQMAHVLGKLRDPQASDTLIRLLDDADSRVATKAAFALGQVGGHSAQVALVDELGRGDDLHRDTVTSALARFRADLGSLIADKLRDPDPAVRAHAADVVGVAGLESSVDDLATLLDDADPDVVLSAVVALGQLTSTQATDALRATAARRRATASIDDRARLVANRLLRERT